jgi:hypothetical protein
MLWRSHCSAWCPAPTLGTHLNRLEPLTLLSALAHLPVERASVYGGRLWQDFSRGAQHDHEGKISYARTFLS